MHLDVHLADPSLEFTRIFVHPIRSDAEFGRKALENGPAAFLCFPAFVEVAGRSAPSLQDFVDALLQ